MDSSTSPNDLIVINTRSRLNANDDFRLQMSTEFDELNNNVPLLTESRASQQQQTSKQLNDQNIDQSNIVVLTKSSSSSCQLTTTIEISNDQQQQQEKQFKCKHCKASFYTHNALSMHIEVFHKSKSESINAQTIQRETSNALFKCCDKVFYTVKEVRIHMQMHIGLPEYKKNVVNPGTISKSTQNEQPNHESEHQFNELTKSSNQFSCLECGQKFLNKRTLYNHIYYSKNVHQKQLQPCEVNWCGKQFKTKGDLYHHYRWVHKAVKFPCTQCKRFKMRKDLMANHLREYHQIDYLALNSIPSDQAVTSLSNCDQQNNSNDEQLDDGHVDDDDEIKFICYHQKFQKQQEHTVTSTVTIQVEKQFHKCKWAMCDRVFVGLEDLRTHVLDVHVYGLNSEDKEDSSKRSIKTLKADEQSIEQVNPVEVIDQDESLLDEIVIDEKSSHISHDHIYHQTDHSPTPPSNANASLRCTLAECVDLTFNHLPNLLRHTRLKHPESLHQIHLKPFRNSRKTTQSNHVLKIVLTSKIKCSLCDKWFQKQDGIEIHVIQEHMTMEMFTSGFNEFTRTLESDEEHEKHRGVQPEYQIACQNESTNDMSVKSYQQALVDIRSESIDKTKSVENVSNETNESDENSIEKIVLDVEELLQPEHQQPLQELNESTKSTQQLLVDSDSNDESIDEADSEVNEIDETNDSDEESFEGTTLENDMDLDELATVETDSESNEDSLNETNYKNSLNGIDFVEKKLRELTMKETNPYESEINNSNEGLLEKTDSNVENSHPQLEHQINVRNESTNDKSDQQVLIESDSNENSMDEADLVENKTDETNDSDESSFEKTDLENYNDLDEPSMNETDSDGEELHQPKHEQSQNELNKPTNKSKTMNSDVKIWRSFRCLHCDKSFEKVDDLKNHFNVFHKKNNDKSDQQTFDETSSDSDFTEELLEGSDFGEIDLNEKSIEEVADETVEFLSGNELSKHSVDSVNSDLHSQQPKHQKFVCCQEQQQQEHRYSERLSLNKCYREESESDFDDQILGEVDSDAESSEVTNSVSNDLHSNADCNETTNANYVPNAIDNEECVDYLAAIKIDNLDYQNEIDMTNDPINPPTHLSTPLSDCIMSQSNPLQNQSVSSNLDQLSANLDQPSLNSIPNHTLFRMNQNSPNICMNLEAASEQSCSIHDISDLITFHSNVQLNQPNSSTHLFTSISDCIINASPSQSILSSLKQSCANFDQPNRNSIPKHTFFQMNQNPNSSNCCMNPETVSEQSIQDISDLMTFQLNQNLDKQSPNLTHSKSNSTLKHTNLTLNQYTTLSIHQPEPQVTQLRKSTKQKSVSCPKCGKKFTLKKCLAVHCFNMHPAQSPLCEVSGCGKTFETKIKLIQHYRDVHSGVNFPCAKCYNRNELIVDHLRTYHKIDFVPPKTQLRQPSLDSTLSTPNQSNSISTQSNVQLNQPNPPNHLIPNPLSDCIMPQSNTLPSQSITSSLEQFCVNLYQPSPNSTQNQTFFQKNQNTNSSIFSMNPETASEQSGSIEDISDFIIFHSNQYQDQSNLNLTQNSESQHIFKQPDPIQCSSVLATDVNQITNSSSGQTQISLIKKSSILQSLLLPSISSPSNVIKKNSPNQVILSSHVPGQDTRLIICTEDNCGKTFRRQSNMKIHQKVVHQGKSLKFRCTWFGCGLEFPRGNQLRKHRELAHTGVTVYKCDKCNHTSTIKSNMTQHQKLVHEKAMFMCKYANCGQMFLDYHLLSKHRRSVHTAGGNYKCEVEDCGMGFDSIGNLRRHREQKHKITD